MGPKTTIKIFHITNPCWDICWVCNSLYMSPLSQFTTFLIATTRFFTHRFRHFSLPFLTQHNATSESVQQNIPSTHTLLITANTTSLMRWLNKRHPTTPTRVHMMVLLELLQIQIIENLISHQKSFNTNVSRHSRLPQNYHKSHVTGRTLFPLLQQQKQIFQFL